MTWPTVTLCAGRNRRGLGRQAVRLRPVSPCGGPSTSAFHRADSLTDPTRSRCGSARRFRPAGFRLTMAHLAHTGTAGDASRAPTSPTIFVSARSFSAR